MPFYVGKGTGARYRKKHSSHYDRIVVNAGGEVPVVKIENLTENEAYELEEKYIRAIGIERDGGPLINLGYGGRGGPVGVKHSAEWCAVRSLRAKEIWLRPEVRAKQLSPTRKRGGNKKPRSASFKEMVSAKMKGNAHTRGKSLKTKSKPKACWKDPAWREKEMARRRATGMYAPEKMRAIRFGSEIR